MNIESIKRKIAYRARFIGLNFDSDDIFHADISSGSTFVALARHYTYEESEIGDVPVKVYHNLLWFEYPQNSCHTTYDGNNSCSTIIDVPLPTLIVRIPSLVYWIRGSKIAKMNSSNIWGELKEEIVMGYVAEFNNLIIELLNEYPNRSTS